MPTYQTGRVAPKNLEHLKELSHQKFGHKLKALKAANNIPPAFDCSDMLGPVKDQGNCGSCWDFSGTGVVEGAIARAGLGKVVLSEEYTLSCGDNGGCSGDDNTTVLAWAKAHGLPTTADYGPYAGRPGQCAYKQNMVLHKIDDWGFADSNGGSGVTPTEDIKAAMIQYGPIGAAIAADNAFMNNPPDKVFHGNSRDINHDIILVGWDDSKGAWRLRNSWGTNWCDHGYCWIAYGANAVGTEAVFAKVAGSPTPPPPPPGPNPPGPTPPPCPCSGGTISLNVPAATVALPMGLHATIAPYTATGTLTPNTMKGAGVEAIPWQTVLQVLLMLFAMGKPAVIQWITASALPDSVKAALIALINQLVP